MPKLVISGLAEVKKELGAGVEPLIDPEVLAKLDGIHSMELCADCLEDEELREFVSGGGRLRFVFDKSTDQFRITTAYEVGRKLTDQETKKLIEFTVAQWSDGIGSGSFRNHRSEVLSTALAMVAHHQGLSIEQLGGIFVDAYPDADQDIKISWLEGGCDDELVQDLIRDAKSGEATAQIELAFRHMRGDGVEQSPEEAFKLFARASESGHPEAVTRLGYCYMQGVGTTLDMKKAVQYLQKGVELGHPMAMGLLADLYHDGNGVEKDPKKGFELYVLGADLGDPVCTHEVAECYELGKGVEKNLKKALKLYKECHEAGVQSEEEIERVWEALGRPESTAATVNVYCTHRNPPPLNFPHDLNSRRDRSDPELMRHLNGFVGFVLQGGQREMTQTIYHVVRHIQRVQHHISIDLEQADLEAFSHWAQEANAIVFLPDGTIGNPHGEVLVHPETGESDDDADVPYPEDAVARKQKNTAQISKKGIPTSLSLPPVVSEVEVELRTPEEVIQRAIALFVNAIRAESIATKQEIPVAELKQKFPNAFAAYMSPKEKEFMNTSKPDDQDVINAAWRYECVFVLEWALGLVDELPFPEKPCEASTVAKTIMAVDQSSFENAKLRPTAEILDCLDLYLRLNWASRQARVEGKQPPKGVDGGVVAERHFALNWLTRFEDADWDDVDTPT